VSAVELLADDAVLESGPTLFIGGVASLPACGPGDMVVEPWREPAVRMQAAGHACAATYAQVSGMFAQAVVVAEKSRVATWAALATAWRHLQPGGRLLVAGDNAVGISSSVKRLAAELGQEATVLSNRRRARVVLFTRAEGPGPQEPDSTTWSVPEAYGGGLLRAQPGVFAAGRCDPGSLLLLDQLKRIDQAPQRIIDLGCGAGLLALVALRRWPAASADVADADARAVADAQANAAAWGMGERCAVHWWDASEPLAVAPADVLVCNPPFHAGKAVDYRAAQAMFRALPTLVARGGRALIVANRQLPYEAELAALGRAAVVAEEAGYKVLEWSHS
jgi:16S rRNA (guanine1207-N2)-methyltransferase